jgi:excisionase family DNA binding protein
MSAWLPRPSQPNREGGAREEVVPSGRARREPQGAAEPLPRLVDIEQVSLSFGISVRQVRRFVAEGQIPYVRIGHLIRFDPAEVIEWIDARRNGSEKAV